MVLGLIHHKRKIIFLHIPKTAGTYISTHLIKNYEFNEFHLTLKDKDSHIKGRLYNTYRENNLGVLQVAQRCPELLDLIEMKDKDWSEYRIFCFVRNPYERLVSAWNYVQQYKKEEEKISFENFLSQKDKCSFNDFVHFFPPQIIHMHDKNCKFAVHYIGRFENLINDCKDILTELGYDPDCIHFLNEKINETPHACFKEFITSQEILDQMNEICFQDFEFFHYPKLTSFSDLEKYHPLSEESTKPWKDFNQNIQNYAKIYNEMLDEFQ